LVVFDLSSDLTLEISTEVFQTYRVFLEFLIGLQLTGLEQGCRKVFTVFEH